VNAIDIEFTAATSAVDQRARRGATPYQAMGIRIGEVTADSAQIWTRLTRAAEANADGVRFLGANTKAVSAEAQFPEGKVLADMERSVPGEVGEIKLSYWPVDEPGEPTQTLWMPVDPGADFTYQFTIDGLRPGTKYALRTESRALGGETVTSTVEGGFRTAPPASAASTVKFFVVGCQAYASRDAGSDGHQVYRAMLEQDPDFFVHTGDAVYYDVSFPYATSLELMRHKWHRMYSFPNQRAFHNRVASYFVKDDHDGLKNNFYRGITYGTVSFDEGLALHREQVPAYALPYRTFRWGRHLQIWLMEGRDFRSPYDKPDGPDKTIWGERQLAWLRRTLVASDATFRVIVTPTPIVGPDRPTKRDNHACVNFAYEGNLVREFLGGQENLFVVSGDLHHHYASEDQRTGLREYGSGAASDAHAGGKRIDPNHPDLRFIQTGRGGFLSVTIEDEEGQATAVIRFHTTDGTVYWEDALGA
jgi:alkaline phosphatase D